MKWLHWIFRRDREEADLDDEIRFHLHQEARLHVQRGESPDEAMRSARRLFGNVTIVQETTRGTWPWTWFHDFLRDLAHSLRLLLRSPWFAAVAVLSLALGIGANTAIFSLADAVIFRDLPVPAPRQLIQLRAVHDRGVDAIYSYPLYQDLRDRSRGVASLACAGSWALIEPVALVLPDASRRDLRARITAVSGNYFETLGVEPAIGRTFSQEEDRAPGASPVAVISYPFWQRELRRDSRVVNTRLLHNGVSYTILGVAAPSFKGISSNDDPDIWVPMMMVDAVLGSKVIANPNTSSLYVFGRLRTGFSLADASSAAAQLYIQLQAARPNLKGQRGEAVTMAKGVQSLRERFERPLLVLLSVVGLLLLIACANLAALLLARAAARRREIAIRLSLGASRGRLLRQFFTESLVIAALGGAAGLAVASWVSSGLIALVTTANRRLPLHFTLDARTLAFTAALSFVVAILFGLLPAWQAQRTRIVDGATSNRSRTGLPAGRILIAAQTAFSLFLLIAAGLFIHSLANLQTLDTGFARENVLIFRLDPRPAFGEDRNKYLALYRDLTERVRAVPGVRSASIASASYFGGSTSRGNITYEGQPGEAPRDEWPVKVRISPGFIATLGQDLLAGRDVSPRDGTKAPQVALVSESVAKRYFPGASAVGKRFAFDSSFQASTSIEIVGVVRDVRYSSLREASPYTVYLPITQFPTERIELQVRTWADPASLTGPVQQAVGGYDPNIRIVHTVTLDRLIQDSIVQDRLLALLAGFFGVLALLLSAIGLFGITAYGVQRRTSEIGIRLALGASSSGVQWMVLREVLWLIAIGCAIGLIAATAFSGAVRSLLFGISPADPLSLSAATGALLLAALLAAWLPARRACRVDPMQTLRCD